MTVPVEVKVTLWGEDQKYTLKELVYGPVAFSSEDSVLKQLLEKAKKEVGFEVQEAQISVKADFEV